MSDVVERYHESLEQGMVMHPQGLYCFYSEVEKRDAEIERLRAELAAVKALLRKAILREEVQNARRMIVKEAADTIFRLRTELAAKQAKIDSLMLEYCPGEMTPEQLKTWGEHQRAAVGKDNEPVRKEPAED